MGIWGLRLWIHCYLSESAEFPAPLLCYEYSLSSWVSWVRWVVRWLGPDTLPLSLIIVSERQFPFDPSAPFFLHLFLLTYASLPQGISETVSHPLQEKEKEGEQSCKPRLCTEARAVALPSAITEWVSLGKIITSRVDFFQAILKSVMKSKQTDVGFYSRHCQELVFPQLRYQITVKTECFRNQTSSVHPMHLHINPTDNYHQTGAHSKGVINDSPSWGNRPYDTPEHPC